MSGTVTGAPQVAPQHSASGSASWGAGRVVAVVVGAVLFLMAGGLLTAGAVLALTDQLLRDDDGVLMSPEESLSTSAYALTTEPLLIETSVPGDYLPGRLMGEVTIRTSADDGALFVGLAETDAAAELLAGVEHTTVVGVEEVAGDTEPVYRHHDGSAPTVLPQESDIWEAWATGTAEQRLTWEPRSGDWTVVLMNADGTAGVDADISVGATVPVLGWVSVVLLAGGGLLLLASLVLVIGAVRRRPA